MAKKNLGRLAGLAALAGAAYMASKGKDKDDAGDQKTSSYTGDTKKVGADASLKSPEESIKSSMAKAPGDSKPITEADVVMPEKAAPKKPTPPRTSTTAKTAPRGDSTRRDLEAGTSRGIPAKQKPVSTVSSSAEDMKNYKSRAASPAAPVPKPKDPAPTSTTTSAPKSEPYKHKMPISSFFEGIRERGNKDLEERGLRGGGKVKKMASGGMTASRRADGIASRGKTKCKMY